MSRTISSANFARGLLRWVGREYAAFVGVDCILAVKLSSFSLSKYFDTFSFWNRFTTQALNSISENFISPDLVQTYLLPKHTPPILLVYIIQLSVIYFQAMVVFFVKRGHNGIQGLLIYYALSMIPIISLESWYRRAWAKTRKHGGWNGTTNVSSGSCSEYLAVVRNSKRDAINLDLCGKLGSACL